MSKELSYDLHIHSCLSPCADPDMTPNNIAGMARVKGLDIIALTDHNSVRNAPALCRAAGKYGTTVIPGMELTTSEEIHVLCLFSELENALAFDSIVYDHLVKVRNDIRFFGEQIYMDENDTPIGEEEYLLINATTISFDDVHGLMASYGGVMIPAHIEKESNSLLSSLGAIPPDSRFTCAELMDASAQEGLMEKHPYLKNCRIIYDSDAHDLGSISEPVHTLVFDHDAPTRAEILERLSGPDC